MTDAAHQSRARGPLSGLVVADFSRVLAGPYATMLLGDLGADVIKVERPLTGDDSRQWGPPFDGDRSTYFLSVNRNKRSITLDLSLTSDQIVARRLAQRADVLVENLKPGAMDRFGLGPDAVLRRNPRIVYCSISGFGTGPGSELAGYDLLAQALGGLMSITGAEDGGPTKVGVAVVDVLTGLHAGIGILAALRHREMTGRGQHVQVNLMSTLLSSLVNQVQSYVQSGLLPARMGNRHPSIAPYEVFLASDRPLVLAVGNDRQFQLLCVALGRPELAADARFATNPLRVRHRDELADELQRVLRERRAADWYTSLSALGVPCGPVNDIAQAIEFAGSLGLDPVVALPDSQQGGSNRGVRHPIDLSATPAGYRLPPPDLGEHSDQVRRWLEESSGPAPPRS